MNYCNKRWNNYGVLSEGDKQGIRTIYGEKRQSPRYDIAQSLVSITDKLGSGQVTPNVSINQLWENIYVEIGGSAQFLHVDTSNPTQTKTWDFAAHGTGSYRYRVWSYTIQDELVNGPYGQVSQRVQVLGYGEGTVYLTKGKSYALTVYVQEYPYQWNPAGYMNLTLK